jgi:Flp pilus assembly protein TadD
MDNVFMQEIERLNPPLPAFSQSNPTSDDGVALAQKGNIPEAEQSFRRSLEQSPDDPVAHHNYAVFLSGQNRPAEATEHYQQTLRLRPHYVEALRNFGILLSSQKQYDQAVGHLWHAVKLCPDDIQTLYTLGTTLLSARRSEEAIPALRQAVRLSPTDVTLHNQLGLVFFDAGRFAEAEETFLNTLRIDPRFASAHNNLGSLCKAMGRVQEALGCFELALALEPDSAKIKWNRALTLLADGDYEHGWEEYEWRWKRPETPPKKFPVLLWNGEPLQDRRILLHAEQGLGDTIQFIRYANLVKQLGVHVLFECPAPLAGVLKKAPGVDQMIIEGQPIPPFDCHAPLLGLPRLLKTTLANVPATVPYITPEPDRVAQWRDRLKTMTKPGELLIGVVWQGNPHHQWDHFRSLPLICYEPLGRIPGVKLVSLQRGPGIEQIEVFQKLTGNMLAVPSDGQQTTPEHLSDTVAIMMNLDLIITVDTAPAHLAGALGKKVWVAMSFVADWRWMVDRADSPWYPTMRLFRQKTHGDWDELMVRIARHLELFKNAQ